MFEKKFVRIAVSSKLRGILEYHCLSFHYSERIRMCVLGLALMYLNNAKNIIETSGINNLQLFKGTMD